MMAKLVLLAALLATGEACFGEFHTTKTVAVGKCSAIRVTTHYCFMLPKFCHKAVATDVESGISTDLAHHFSCDNHGFNSSKEYVQAQAIHDLFNLRLVPTTNINASDTCNCQHHDQKVGMCALRSTTCSMFNETTDVTKQAFSWQAWATDLTTSNVGHHKDKHGSATPSAAEAAALADLVKRYPAEAGCKNASAA